MNKLDNFLNHPWYGNYVGPGNNPGMPPVGNGLDKAAQIHDMAYRGLGAKGGVRGAVFDLNTVKVDWEFVIRAFAAIGSEKTWYSRRWAIGTTIIFGMISILKTIFSLLVMGTLSFVPLFFPERKDGHLGNLSDLMLDRIDKILSTSDTSETDYETDMGSVVLIGSQNTNLSKLEDTISLDK